MHKFRLKKGEMFKIGGIPFVYVGNGQAEGGTDPEFARRMRGDKSQQTDDSAA